MTDDMSRDAMEVVRVAGWNTKAGTALKKRDEIGGNAIVVFDMPVGWHVTLIKVRRDHAWCYGGTLTYDAVIECQGCEVTGSGSDPAWAVKAAVREIPHAI
jgi:hypothetical protein